MAQQQSEYDGWWSIGGQGTDFCQTYSRFSLLLLLLLLLFSILVIWLFFSTVWIAVSLIRFLFTLVGPLALQSWSVHGTIMITNIQSWSGHGTIVMMYLLSGCVQSQDASKCCAVRCCHYSWLWSWWRCNWPRLKVRHVHFSAINSPFLLCLFHWNKEKVPCILISKNVLPLDHRHLHFIYLRPCNGLLRCTPVQIPPLWWGSCVWSILPALWGLSGSLSASPRQGSALCGWLHHPMNQVASCTYNCDHRWSYNHDHNLYNRDWVDDNHDHIYLLAVHLQWEWTGRHCRILTSIDCCQFYQCLIPECFHLLQHVCQFKDTLEPEPGNKYTLCCFSVCLCMCVCLCFQVSSFLCWLTCTHGIPVVCYFPIVPTKLQTCSPLAYQLARWWNLCTNPGSFVCTSEWMHPAMVQVYDNCDQCMQQSWPVRLQSWPLRLQSWLQSWPTSNPHFTMAK